MKLTDALVAAKGVRYWDHPPRRARLIRVGGNPKIHTLTDLNRSPEKDPLLEPGDTIELPRRIF